MHAALPLTARCSCIPFRTPPASLPLLPPSSPAEHIPKELLQYYQRLLASQPARRLNFKQLLEAGVLRNRLAEATLFLENLAIKDSQEKVWAVAAGCRAACVSWAGLACL